MEWHFAPTTIDPDRHTTTSCRAGTFGQPIFRRRLDARLPALALARRRGAAVDRRLVLVPDDEPLSPSSFSSLKAGCLEGMRELNGWLLALDATSRRTDRHRPSRQEPRSRWRPVANDEHFLGAMRYVPISTRFAPESATQPEEWPWSGYRATSGSNIRRPFHRRRRAPAVLRRRPRRRATVRSFTRTRRRGHGPWSDQGFDVTSPRRG